MTRRPMSEQEKTFLGVEPIEVLSTGSLGAGLNESTPIQPPSDEVWELLDLYLHAPAIGGASSGNHTFELEDHTNDDMLRGQTGFSNPARFEHHRWDNAMTVAEPSAAKELQNIFSSMHIYNDRPLEVIYINGSDAVQTGARTIRYVVRKWKK